MEEIEVKFKISDPEEIRKKLKKMGAISKGSVNEKNITFDDPERDFGNDVKMLRVRDDGKVTITYKGKPKEGKFKKRREIEILSDNYEASVELIKSLGFKPAWSYQKIREGWLLGETYITIDKLPQMGYWMEIEGTEEEIDSVIQSLGFNPDEGTSKTYKRIFQEYCEKNNIEFGDMVFK